MFSPSRTFSYSPSFRGFSGRESQGDYPQQRRPPDHDDFRAPPLQRNGMFRPNGKSIYLQRKEYSDTLNRESETHFRVEHLLTCELDGRELKTLDDCVAKLKRLDNKGRLWPQQMIMEVHRGHLVLSEIETKTELEAIPLRWVLDCKAVLDSCAYNSVLTLTIDERSRRSPQVYMFQCEETGAEVIKADLDKVIDYRGGPAEVNDKFVDYRGGPAEANNKVDYRSGPAEANDFLESRRAQPEIKINLENIIGKNFRQLEPFIIPRERSPPVPDFPPPQWNEFEAPPRSYSPRDYPTADPDYQDPPRGPEVPTTVEEDSRNNTEIFNHVLQDLEIFMDKISKATALQEEQPPKKKGMNFMKKSKKKKAPPLNLPPDEEYVFYLQKLKYSFNLLAQLEGVLSNPTAPEFVNMLFDGLAAIVSVYPQEVPPSVVSPLLTEGALDLLGSSTSNEQKQLWASLGDSWNIPRSSWPEDIPPYVPEFYDGWQPPAPAPPPYQNHISNQLPRSNSQQFHQQKPPGRPQQEQHVREEPWNPPSPRSSEPPLYARAMYDFTGRNSQELTISKGDMVQVMKRSSHWWLIRNNYGEEGSVPQNVLELMSGNGPAEDRQPHRSPRGAPTLDNNSTPPEVKAWLEQKGFSRITVTTLGILTGRLLLGMTKDEIRTVCPEEGSKVFFQLQSIKSSMALASEQTGMFGRRY